MTLLKGALVSFTPTFLTPAPNVTVFQFNPETMTHTWSQPDRGGQAAPSSGIQAGNPLAVPGMPGEEFSLTVVFDSNQDIEDRIPVSSQLGEVSGVKLRRLTVNLSKQGPLFQEMKWFSEKHIEHRMETCTVTRAQAIGSAEACLVSRNDPMHDSVPYLRNALPDDTDILHEYFIPRSQFVSFVDGMRKVLTDNKTNLLNASVRVVHQEGNFLTYAPEPAFSLVLYINQTTDEDGNRRMKKATEELIDLTIAHKGRFFLPYQLYYSRDQLQRSYPQINDFFAAKRKYDPGEVFTNTFYQKYGA